MRIFPVPTRINRVEPFQTSLYHISTYQTRDNFSSMHIFPTHTGFCGIPCAISSFTAAYLPQNNYYPFPVSMINLLYISYVFIDESFDYSFSLSQSISNKHCFA